MTLSTTQLEGIRLIARELEELFPEQGDDLWQAAILIFNQGLGPEGTGGDAAFRTLLADIAETQSRLQKYQGRHASPDSAFNEAIAHNVPFTGELPPGTIGNVARGTRIEDESRQEVTNMAIDTLLAAAVETNSLYSVEITVICDVGSGGIKLDVSAPNTSVGTLQYGDEMGTTTLEMGTPFTSATTGLSRLITIRGSVLTGGDGILALSWAQNTSNISPTIVKSGSFLRTEQLSSGVTLPPPVVIPPDVIDPPIDPGDALPRTIGNPNSWWNKDITGLDVHPSSATWLAQMQLDIEATHDYGLDGQGGQYWLPRMDLNMQASENYGHNINIINADNDGEIIWHVPTAYTEDGPYNPHGDFLQVPYHPSFLLQNFGEDVGGDNHLYVWDQVRNQLREHYRVVNYDAAGTTLTTGLSTIYDLDVTEPGRGLGCTSANASGSVYAPLLPTPDDFVAGEINHAIGLTLSNTLPEGFKFIYPAVHSPLQYLTGGYLPYGARFRLKASFNVAGIQNTNARIICTALQKYGFFHIDGINAQPLLPCVNDALFTTKWRDLSPQPPAYTTQFNAFNLWFHAGLPQWTDFEIIDGTTEDMRNVSCARTQYDERGLTLPDDLT